MAVLERRGYLDRWTVTEAGGRLAGLYHEADLLIAEALESGQLDGLDPASLAAVASGFCYEARREREAPFPAPSAKVAQTPARRSRSFRRPWPPRSGTCACR